MIKDNMKLIKIKRETRLEKRFTQKWVNYTQELPTLKKRF